MAFARDVNFWSLHPSKKTNYRLVIRRFVLIRRLFFRRLSPVEIFFFSGLSGRGAMPPPKSPVVLFSINWDKCSAHWPDPLAFASINTSRRRSFVYQRHLLRGGSGRSCDGKCHGPLTMSRWKMSRLLNVNKVLVQWMGGVPLTPQSRLQLEEKVHVSGSAISRNCTRKSFKRGKLFPSQMNGPSCSPLKSFDLSCFPLLLR